MIASMTSVSLQDSMKSATVAWKKECHTMPPRQILPPSPQEAGQTHQGPQNTYMMVQYSMVLCIKWQVIHQSGVDFSEL